MFAYGRTIEIVHVKTRHCANNCANQCIVVTQVYDLSSDDYDYELFRLGDDLLPIDSNSNRL